MIQTREHTKPSCWSQDQQRTNNKKNKNKNEISIWRLYL